MATIRHHTRIAAPPDKVWALVTDTGNIGDWMPGVDESSQEGDVRTVKLGPMEIKEQIVTNDAELRRMQYSIIDPPMGTHLATVDVFEDGDGSFLVYSCDISPDDMFAILDPTYAGATDAIKQHIES
jgi:carbon monoxide dehydrogenase subunit G